MKREEIEEITGAQRRRELYATVAVFAAALLTIGYAETLRRENIGLQRAVESRARDRITRQQTQAAFLQLVERNDLEAPDILFEPSMVGEGEGFVPLIVPVPLVEEMIEEVVEEVVDPDR